MATKIYSGINDVAQQNTKLYVGIDNIARRIKKVYIGVNNIAKLCYGTLIKVFYNTSLSTTFSSKEIYPGEKYGDFPIKTNSNRVDFWFYENDTAKRDKNKKYIDYPWCAYADKIDDVYYTYGYAQDKLAQHWHEIGKASGFPLGGVNPNTICAAEENHTLYHVFRPLKVTFQYNEPESEISWADWAGYNVYEISCADGSDKKEGGGTARTLTIYPGQKIKFLARYRAGWFSSPNAWIKINGTKVAGADEIYEYVVPNNISKITVNVAMDFHTPSGGSFQISITTTKL